MSHTEPVTVPMNVEWQPCWLTWVSATTTCLRALGVDCDCADVAGMSGYAFVLNVHKELCPSGPTAFDWGMLAPGVNALGRSTLQFPTSDCSSPETRANCQAAYEVVAQEVAAGRPCVLWGAYVPEFAAAIGVQDGCFLVKSFREVRFEPQPPIPCEELQAPGGPYVLAFPTRIAAVPGGGDARAITHAAELLLTPNRHGDYGFGLAAYGTWVAFMEGEGDNTFGNAYNTQCYAQGRALAHKFLTRVLARNPKLAEPLGSAVSAYEAAARAMGQLAQLFPFPARDELSDRPRRQEAVGLLRSAQKAEASAADALRVAAATWPA